MLHLRYDGIHGIEDVGAGGELRLVGPMGRWKSRARRSSAIGDARTAGRRPLPPA